MGKKNRKNKKKKKGKESDDRGSSTGGGSNNNNNNHNNNNHNNNIWIPTVDDETVVATTTMVLTQQDLEIIDNTFKLKGYPKSTDFVIGYKYYKEKQDDLAIASFKPGADNDGCVPCMFYYVDIQGERGNFYLLLPYALEGAIRGKIFCMDLLTHCYNRSKPTLAPALMSFWMKTRIELGPTALTEEQRKEVKKSLANMCFICDKEDLEDNDVTLVKCGICKYYSYCGKSANHIIGRS